MASTKQQRILVASDGSQSAEAVITTVLRFPWKASARAQGVVANFPWLRTESEAAQAAVEISVEIAAETARRALRRRWPAAQVTVANAPPADAILAAAKESKANVIAVGWRGHGVFQRLIAGSISRAVASSALCSVLVAREAPKAIRRIVVGYDGSPNAIRAIGLLASLAPPRGGRVILVDAVVPRVTPAARRIPASIRRELQHYIQMENEERRESAQKLLASGASRLERAGWKVHTEVRAIAPVAAILAAADEHAANAIVVGACAKTRVQRAVLGSVANDVLNRSPVPVLLVR